MLLSTVSAKSSTEIDSDARTTVNAEISKAASANKVSKIPTDDGLISWQQERASSVSESVNACSRARDKSARGQANASDLAYPIRSGNIRRRFVIICKVESVSQ